MVGIYYQSDQVVEEDRELQDFVKDVYVYGMRGKKASGTDRLWLSSWPSLLCFPCTSDSLGQCCPMASTLVPSAGARAPKGPLPTSMSHGDISETFYSH